MPGRTSRWPTLVGPPMVVRRVRGGAMPDAQLTIVGSPVDQDYTKRLRRLAASDSGWVELRENLTRAQLNELMGRSRYGLQAMEDEHFGMATAEMLRAGCLAFPHRSGGSPEVVDDDERLLWRSEDEAVTRITAVVRDPDLQREIRSRMRTHSRAFSTERFVEQAGDRTGGLPQLAEGGATDQVLIAGTSAAGLYVVRTSPVNRVRP